MVNLPEAFGETPKCFRTGKTRGTRVLPCQRPSTVDGFRNSPEAYCVVSVRSVNYPVALMLRLVLFDIDGTLIHTDSAGIRAFAKVLEMQFKIPKGTEGVKFAGRTDTSLVREIFALHRIETSKENFHIFFEQYTLWLAHLLLESKGDIYPGVWRFIYELQRLPEPPLLGLLTGNIRLGAEIKLRHFNLWDFFTTGAFGDDHEDRRQIAAIAHERGARVLDRKITGEEVLVIGDTPRDIDCGKAIGAKVLAVATGDSTMAELQAHNPTWAVSSLDKVRAKEICRL